MSVVVHGSNPLASRAAVWANLLWHKYSVLSSLGPSAVNGGKLGMIMTTFQTLPFQLTSLRLPAGNREAWVKAL
jgi:hypothetical protein